MKKIQYLLMPSICLVVFIIWTILVKTVDVHYINEIGFLGFYSLNTSINNAIQSLPMSTFNLLTNVLLYLSLATIIPFFIMGLVQLIVRKSFLKVDKVIYIMLASYVAMAVMYFIFDLVKINYSPLSTPQELKPSYPSSHVMIFMTVLGTNLYGLFHYVKLPKFAKIASLCCVFALFIAMAVFRTLSGHHYFSDIIGAILFAFVLLTFFDFLVRLFLKEPKPENE